MEAKLQDIKTEYIKEIAAAQTLKELDELFLKLFGKTGVFTTLGKELPKVPKNEISKVGPLFNQVKTDLEKGIQHARTKIQEEGYKKLDQESFDLNPKIEPKKRTGYMHPMTQFEDTIVKLFSDMGFQQFDAPHIDTDQNNFEVLNIPPEHPARDLWDTFYIDTTDGRSTINDNLLLRTHTSNSQIRIMKENKLPIRMMCLGRCFRYENVDARHEHTFEQFEIVYIDKGLNMANLQYLSEVFLKAVFGPDMKARLRPKYYPFVEPGVGVDGLCMFCKGKGCKVCGGVGWLELAGAGMMHPHVLKNGGIDPNEYSGIAWGFGPARMLMLKYGVNDMRLFNTGDLTFLQEISKACDLTVFGGKE